MKRIIFTVLILLSATLTFAGVPPTLIAHYKMNDDDATADVVDFSGNGHTGEYQLDGTAQNTNTSDELGKINRALDFVGGVGSGEHVEITSDADFSPGDSTPGSGTPFSISIWAYMDTANDFVLASRFHTGGVENEEWLFYVTVSKILNFRIYDDDASAAIGSLYNTSMASYEGQWVHLVGTYDGGTSCSGVKIYINGMQVDTTDHKTGTFVAVEKLTHPVWIGRYSTTHCANGLIDNVMFFSAELSLDEVKRLHNNRNGTEILTELDSVISPRRSNASPLGWRARYEW